LINYYDEKSKDGYLSLVVIEHSYVSQQGKAGDKQLSVTEDRLVRGLKKLADTIHKNGSKTVMQINHAGSGTRKEVTGM
jgi:2,4-dienoyl-CoA reductase-like NADH-dependent reductase (Old Yellow Enzyme family)